MNICGAVCKEQTKKRNTVIQLACLAKLNIASTGTLYFDSNTLKNTRTREKHQSNCYFKIIRQPVITQGRNSAAPNIIYVHIRVCNCIFPDRRGLISGDQLVFGDIYEQDGVEFHTRENCEWIPVGDNHSPTLKRGVRLFPLSTGLGIAIKKVTYSLFSLASSN